MNNPKLFGAFVNGIHKKLFEKNAEINPQFLKDQIFGDQADITVDQVSDLAQNVQDILEDAAREDYEIGQFETALKQTNFDAAQQEILAKYWRTQRTKVHEFVAKETVWNDTLQKLAWRVDSKTKSKNVAEMNELTTIVELTVNKRNSTTPDIVRFEMDKDQLASVARQIKEIQKQLSKNSS